MYKQAMSHIPTNMRTFAGSMLGDNSLITEKNFKPEELEVMRKNIRAQRAKNAEQEAFYRQQSQYAKANIGKIRSTQYNKDGTQTHTRYGANDFQKQLRSYTDTRDRTAISYGGDSSMMTGDAKESSLRRSFNSPEYNVHTTLGSYVGNKAPNGDTIVTDNYDFSKPKDISAGKVMEGLGQIRNLRQLGNFAAKTLRPNVSRPVRINLGPPTKRKQGTQP